MTGMPQSPLVGDHSAVAPASVMLWMLPAVRLTACRCFDGQPVAGAWALVSTRPR